MANQYKERAFAQELFERLAIAPTGIESRERPDLIFILDGKKIGMEITESTPSEVLWGEQIVEELNNDPLNPIIYSPTHLRDHGRQRTRKELFEDMFNNHEWRNMDETRREFCECVRKQWERKRAKLNEESFEKFDENWLLIWDHHGLGNDSATVTRIQGDIIQTPFLSRQGKEFDRVSVIAADYTFVFMNGKVTFLHKHSDQLNAWLQNQRETNR